MVISAPRIIAFLSLSLFWANFPIAQTTDEAFRAIIDKINASQDLPSEALNGKKIVYELYVTVDGQRKLKTTLTFNKLNSGKWRLDSERADGTHYVVVRNKGLYFAATKLLNSQAYRENAIGYSESVRLTVMSSADEIMGFVKIGRRVLEMDLIEFLQLPELKIKSIVNLVSRTKGDACKIAWTRLVPETRVETSGEIVIIKDDYYLIESNIFRAKKNVVTVENDYSVEESQLVLRRSVQTHTDSRLEYVLKSIAAANSDRKFYTPQSIGLTTPFNPIWWMYGWIVLGCIFLLMAISYWRSCPTIGRPLQNVKQ